MHRLLVIFPDTVKHVYFVSTKFFKYMHIFGIAHHHDFVCIEYKFYRDMICNVLGNLALYNVNNNTGLISITFV